jgi:hypothetical protein
MGVLWSLLSLVASAQGSALVCLRAGSPAPDLHLESVERALAARVRGYGIDVVLCDAARLAAATWQVSLWSEPGGSVAVDLVGPHVARLQTLSVATRDAPQAAQMVAVAVAENLRPAAERWLLELGSSDGPPIPLAAADAEPPPLKERARATVDAAVGPVLDSRGAAALWLELASRVPLGDLALTLHAGMLAAPDRSRAGMEVSRRAYEMGLGCAGSFAGVELGLVAKARALTASASSAAKPRRTATFWSAGIGVTSSFTLWSSSAALLALRVDGWFWPRPHRLSYDGDVFLTEGFVELFAGPVLRVGW